MKMVDRETLERLYLRDQHSIQECAGILGISGAWARTLLKRYGIPSRGQGWGMHRKRTQLLSQPLGILEILAAELPPGVWCRSLDFLGFDKYAVTSIGDVWSSWQLKRRFPPGTVTIGPWRKLVLNDDVFGYHQVNLCDGVGSPQNTYVHELVLLAFVGPRPDSRMDCRHFPDPDPTNNRLENLSWGTRKENAHDRVIHGTAGQGEKASNVKLTEGIVREIRTRYASGDVRQRQLAAEFGITQSMVWRISRRKAWLHI